MKHSQFNPNSYQAHITSHKEQNPAMKNIKNFFFYNYRIEKQVTKYQKNKAPQIL